MTPDNRLIWIAFAKFYFHKYSYIREIEYLCIVIYQSLSKKLMPE